MPLVLPMYDGGPPVVLKQKWEGYEKGIDSSRGPWIRQVYLTEEWPRASGVVNALRGQGLVRPPVLCPEANNLYCVDARATGVGEVDDRAGGLPNFRLGEIEVTYAIPAFSYDGANPGPQFPTDGEPYLFMEQQISFDVEIYKVPDTSYVWQDDNTTVDVPTFRKVPVAEFTVIRKFQSTLPYTNVTKYLLGLNDSSLFGQDKGLLQLRKVDTKTSYLSDGTRASDVTYKFKWRKYDHNKEFKPSIGAFQFMVDKQKKMRYEYQDLSQVLV